MPRGPLSTAATSGWGTVDRILGQAAVGLAPEELRVARLTAAFSLALILWGPLFAGFYALLGAYRLAGFVVLAVICVASALGAVRRSKREFAAHLLLLGLLGVLVAIATSTRAVFSPTLMWLPVLPVMALLLLGRKAALAWGGMAILAIFVFAAAAFSGQAGEGVFTGAQLTAYHAVSLLSTVMLQASLAMLFESAKVRMAEELAAQRDEAARAREQLVRAEERSRMKSDFLASTSHELRTPLNTIINIPQGILDVLVAPRRVRCAGCAQRFELEDGEAPPAACPACGGALVLQPVDTLEPAVTTKLLRSVVTSGKHLLTVVNDILDYSRLEAGGQNLVRERIPLKEVLEQLEAVIAPVAQKAGVGLRIPPAPEASLSVDRVKIAQVLINLVSNAIKFSNGKGEVAVSSTVLDGWVQLEVRDQGIGIASEHLSLIFEGFRQVDQGTSRRYGGTGLGLAISKRLVELHGGKMEVESRIGVGSTFRVCLPAASGQAAADQLGAGPLVLIIDDEASDAAELALRPLGGRVVALRDPSTALERIRVLRPAVVILDVLMPRLSGFEVLRQLNAETALAPLAVLVTSAYPDNRSIAEGLGATFMDKPWVAEELRAFVKAHSKGAVG